jgi:predicted nucleic acid-binding protein
MSLKFKAGSVQSTARTYSPASLSLAKSAGESRRFGPTDPVFASQLELWLRRLKVDYQDRILSITEEIAEFWGTICPSDPLPEPDGLIAATALHHGMTLVTRNVEHVQRSGVKLLNPWENT